MRIVDTGATVRWWASMSESEHPPLLCQMSKTFPLRIMQAGIYGTLTA